MTAAVVALGAALFDAPLLWLAVTVAAFAAGRALHWRAGRSPWANPVLIAIGVVCALLVATHTTYSRYLDGVRPLSLMLGPATVALATPFVANVRHVSRRLLGVGLAVVAGSVTATVVGMVLVRLLGGSREVALSMAPKAATSAIAMAVGSRIGANVSLSALFAVMGGVAAAVMVQGVLARSGIDDHRAQGLAAGVSGSGIGGAHVAALGETAAAFAAVGIALNGLVTALLTPLLARWL